VGWTDAAVTCWANGHGYAGKFPHRTLVIVTVFSSSSYFPNSLQPTPQTTTPTQFHLLVLQFTTDAVDIWPQ